MDPSTMTGNEIVITGIAGRFPNSENVNILQKNLLDMVDCVTDEPRWDCNNPNIPSRTGKLKEVTKFDRVFFGVHPKLANAMIPEMRIITECGYEAVADAGINPRHLKGSRTSVYTATTFAESEKALFYEKFEQNCIMGTSRSMLANRISFYLGLVGQSINIDASCCGSVTALEQAYLDMKHGRSHSAIVGGVSLALHPYLSLHMSLLGLLSPEGKTKSFDDGADGFARSESVVVLFLQKARDAKRIYAEVKNVLSLAGPTDDQLPAFYPTSEFQADVMKKTLKGAGLTGKDIDFVEADGLGIVETDAQEVKAIDLVFNEGRNSPLLIGSVRSNIGSCSNANSLNSIVKVITAMDKGIIPPNLHYKNPSRKIPPLTEGRVKVVNEKVPWKGKYAVINTLAITGVAANIILKSYKKQKKNGGEPSDDLPRLVVASGSTEESVAFILDEVESKPVDVEMLQLLYNVFESENIGHLYRGYSLLPPRGLLKTKNRQIEYNSGSQKQVWFIFSGMGSQWVGMGEALLRIPIFAAAIRKCDAVLKPRGVDIFRILTEKDPKMFDYIINAFVGITAVQIGLTDILTSIGIKPDYIIGHSLGELGCGYADGCITAQQMVLCALVRGLASVEANMIKGSMAAVGLGYEDIQLLCPPDIDVACHNSAESTTISGPAESMKKFVEKLTNSGIFAREVACGNIAYHSRYMQPVRDLVLGYFNKEIPNPKPRTDRWLSTSVPRNEWGTPKARLCSGSYHMNNQLSPVLFAETVKAIPSDAIAIEIAPHGLMQAIFRKSLPQGVVNVPLTKRGHPDNVEFLMAALGKLYSAGLNPQISKLYPSIEYPVSSGTPSISSLIQWDHSNDWYTSFYEKPQEQKQAEMKFPIKLENEVWEFLKGNKIDDKIVLPSALYLKLAWTVLEELSEEKGMSIVFENVQICKHQVVIPENEEIVLVVMVQKGTGIFEVTNNNILLCSGVVRSTEKPADESIKYIKSEKNAEELDGNSIYTELQMRGFQYSESFRSIIKSSKSASNGTLIWKQNWITFLEGMIQMSILGNDIRKIQLPIKIKKIVIDKKHQDKLKRLEEIPIEINQQLNVITAGGVEMQGISLKSILQDSSTGEVIIEGIQKPEKALLNSWNFTKIKQNLSVVQNWKANQIRVSDPNSITWVEGHPCNDLEIEKTVKVEYAAVNSSDLLLATGELVSEETGRDRLNPKTFGLEYAGISSKGTRIMGLSSSGTLSNVIRSDSIYTWTIPKSWSLRDASTVPLAYTVVYNALYLKGKIKKGGSVLIYDGISGFGQAAINLATHEECEITITYNNNEDKKLLQNLYPFIPQNRLCCSTDAFADHILAKTKGEGVDIIIYNGSDLRNIETCFICAKANARVIVIGDLQGAFSESVGMEIFLKEVSLYSVVPRRVVEADLCTKEILAKMVEDGLKSGVVKPLYGHLYDRERLSMAFADSLVNKVYGKIIVKVQPKESKNQVLAVSQFLCSKKGSYIIIEGTSNFGLELIDFLISRGARNIIIASSKKNERRFCDYRLDLLRGYGVNLIFRDNLDLSEQQNAQILLKEASLLGPIDVIFDLQRMNNLSQRSSCSKDLFTKFLEEHTTKYCPNLRKFVICFTVRNIKENLNDLLLQESEMVKFCERKSESRILVLWGPMAGIVDVKSLKDEKIALLTIPRALEHFDDVMGAKFSIVRVFYESLIKETVQEVHKIIIVEENEKKLFENYINKVDPLTTSKFKSLDV
ncbi:fatty acid synthase-like isoform X2 [Belonocnema kinseyi]|nr:fatty acid synthase-like isoform X2 [Belonocnema kinseyi]